MIRASELRIGNLVQSDPILGFEPEPRVYEVTGLFIRQIDALPTHQADNYSGIPLSEEWLVKFGFVKHIEDFRLYRSGVVFKYQKYAINEIPDNAFDIWQITEDDDYIPLRLSVRYVHQLMNLYHALTGEELSIKQ